MQVKALLTQLGYNTDEASIARMQQIINNTDGLDIQSIITLNDHLKPHLCFVAMSSSADRLKIKNTTKVEEIKNEVDEIIDSWAKKYKMRLEKINETTHYILGK